jgi:hypothetical protein
MFIISVSPLPLACTSFSIRQEAVLLNASRFAYSWYCGYHLIMPGRPFFCILFFSGQASNWAHPKTSSEVRRKESTGQIMGRKLKSSI